MTTDSIQCDWSFVIDISQSFEVFNKTFRFCSLFYFLYLINAIRWFVTNYFFSKVTQQIAIIFHMNPPRDWRGPAGLFRNAGYGHFLRRDIKKVAFKIARNGMRYTHGTGNFINFYLVNGKNMKWTRDIGTNNSVKIW